MVSCSVSGGTTHLSSGVLKHDTSIAQRMRILEIDNRLQSERKMRQELEMQHIQEKNGLASLVGGYLRYNMLLLS
jgi:hypothetical protein